jgi:uncharacterized protein YbjT (DUF2867 family)
MDEKTVAVAGGSGFIGRAIVRRLAQIPATRVRLLTRDAERVRRKFEAPLNVEFVDFWCHAIADSQLFHG